MLCGIEPITIGDDKNTKEHKVGYVAYYNKKIMELTDWKPKYTFEQGLAETIEFLRKNLERYKTDIYNL